MTTNEKQNKQPEAGKKELTPRQIQMRKKMVVFPLFFLAFAGCMWLIFSPGEKEREEPSAGFNTELPTPESEGILSDKRDAYVQEEMRRREREKMRSLQDFAFGMEDEEEEPVMPAAVPDKSSGPAGGSSGAFRTSRAAYADINRQLGSFNVDYLTFKITDKKVAKRTAIQEQVVWPVRAYNNVQVIGGKRTERMVFTLPKFTLADDKQLVVELHEQQGGRHQTFTVENADLVRARVINELKVK